MMMITQRGPSVTSIFLYVALASPATGARAPPPLELGNVEKFGSFCVHNNLLPDSNDGQWNVIERFVRDN